jgi:hypothetical protein
LILITIRRLSPFACRASITHIDYQKHPSRSWVVADYEVEVGPREEVREAVLKVARELLQLQGPEVAADLAAGASSFYIQPELPGTPQERQQA